MYYYNMFSSFHSDLNARFKTCLERDVAVSPVKQTEETGETRKPLKKPTFILNIICVFYYKFEILSTLNPSVRRTVKNKRGNYKRQK